MKLIVDCDPGNGLPATDVDDGLALALAWATPDVELAAVTVVEGNVPHDTGARIAAALTDLARGDGAPRTPVHEGHRTAAGEPAAAWRRALAARRRDGLADRLWRDVRARLGPAPGGADAVDALVDLIGGAPGEHTLVTLGPLTNIAAAERRRPGLLRDCARVVVLGGAFAGPLGVRELNFAMDPEAADAVLAAGAALTLLPLDVTRTTWLTAGELRPLHAAPGALVRHLAATAEPWVRWIAQSRGWPGANPHDLLAVAIAVAPDLVVDARRCPVAVELAGDLTRSRPVRLPDEAAGPAPGTRDRPAVDVVTDVDRDGFAELVRQRLLAFGTDGTDRRTDG